MMSVTQLPSSNDRLIVTADIATLPPVSVFDYWTKPELLCQWWPQEAEVDAQVGGAYHLSWPQMNWHLRGHYTCFEPGKQLAFTWKWDHEEDDAPVREVMIAFEPLPDIGARLTLTHGPYSDTIGDQEMRIEHHLEGWKHFIPRLQQLVEAS